MNMMIDDAFESFDIDDIAETEDSFQDSFEAIYSEDPVSNLVADISIPAERPPVIPPEKPPDWEWDRGIDWGVVVPAAIAVGVLGTGLYYGIKNINEGDEIPPSAF